MKIIAAIFFATLILILIGLLGGVKWSTVGTILAISGILVIIGVVGFFIVMTITKKSNRAEH